MGDRIEISFYIPKSQKVISTEEYAGLEVERVVIHEGVTKIERDAFRGCSRLQTVIFEGTPHIHPRAFFRCFNFKEFVIRGPRFLIAKEVFQNTGSSTFKIRYEKKYENCNE